MGFVRSSVHLDLGFSLFPQMTQATVGIKAGTSSPNMPKKIRNCASGIPECATNVLRLAVLPGDKRRPRIVSKVHSKNK